MSLSNSMMQRRATVHIRRIHRTIILQHKLHNRHIANSSSAVQRQLAALVFDAGGSFVREEFLGRVEIGLACGEVKGRLAVVGLGGDVSLFGEEEVEERVAVFDARGDHESRPACAVLGVDIEVLALREELYDWESVVAGRTM